ncbi:MAG: hypothetical protein LBC80_10170 [Treponema sp.]|jgi:hypothetical protein|nr:hypothetical protein [Treponema sp.]
MSSIIYIILFAVLGIGLGVLFCFLVIKKYPEADRKIGYVKTVFVFMIMTAALCAIVQGKFFIDSAVGEYANTFEEHVNENHSNSVFARQGYNLSNINTEAEAKFVIDDIKRIINHEVLGVSRRLYNFITNPVFNQLQKKIMAMGDSENQTDDGDDKFLTVESVINDLQGSISFIVTIAFIVLLSIIIIFFAVQIIKPFLIVSKEKKRLASVEQN